MFDTNRIDYLAPNGKKVTLTLEDIDNIVQQLAIELEMSYDDLVEIIDLYNFFTEEVYKNKVAAL